MPRAMDSVRLAWALDRQGLRVRVTDLDPRLRASRAPFRCIGCGADLTARLGRVRARHFAHQPGSRCPLTAPETALHLDAKERLLRLCEEAFAGRRRVVLEVRCPDCRRRAPLDLFTLGDGAVSEGSVGRLRADVLVTRRGTPSAVLEVRVAHALAPEKEAALAQMSLPVIEIDAREEWETEADGEIRVACARSLGVSRCAACQAGARADGGRLAGGEDALIAELETYRLRGLLGTRPGPPVAEPAALSPAEVERFVASFRCAQCGGEKLEVGAKLVRHTCPGEEPRAVVWRGYDGTLVLLEWWRRA